MTRVTAVLSGWKEVACSAICLAFTLPIFADEIPDSTSVRDEQFDVLVEKLQEYQFELPNEMAAEFLHTPLLRWTNPIRKTHDGGVFLWTADARPVAISCVFWRNEDTYKHELQSLSEQPFTFSLDETVWSPEAPGVTFERLKPGPGVPKSVSPRLVQMRRIAASFKAFTGRKERGGSALRLLPQPIYRYPDRAESEGIIDGAVFAFVQSTDPEVLLLIEARETDNDAYWFVAFARMSKSAQYVLRDESVVWSCNWINGSRTKTYNVLTYDVIDSE